MTDDELVLVLCAFAFAGMVFGLMAVVHLWDCFEKKRRNSPEAIEQHRKAYEQHEAERKRDYDASVAEAKKRKCPKHGFQNCIADECMSWGREYRYGYCKLASSSTPVYVSSGGGGNYWPG